MGTSFNLKNAVLTLSDGASTPNTLTIKMAEGNLTYSEKVDRKYLMNRGILDTVIDGDDQPLEMSFEGRWEFIKGDSEVTIEDFLKQANGAAAYVSSDTNTCAPFAVDVILTHTPICATQKIETLTFSDFRYESLDHDAKAATIAVKGRCNITKVSSTRTSQS